MSDFPEKAKDEVNTLAVVAIGLSTTAILWASVLALQAFFMNSEGEVATQQAQNGRAAIVRGLKAEHKADLSRTTYADQLKGTLKRLDIQYAKEVVVRDAQRGVPNLIPLIKEYNVPTIDLNGKPLQAATPPAVAPAAVTPAAVTPAVPVTGPPAASTGTPATVPPATTATPTAVPAGVPTATPSRAIPTATPPTAVPAPSTP